MDRESLKKGLNLTEQIDRINEELELLNDGNIRCDLSYGEGSKWQPLKGVNEGDLRNTIIDKLLEKKGELIAKFEKL